MARQDSRHGGPEESRDAKSVYCLKASTAKVDRPCYFDIIMLPPSLRVTIRSTLKSAAEGEVAVS